MQKGLITGLVFAVVMVIFTLQNPVNLSIKFLFWKISEIPAGLFLVLSISLGVILAAIFSFIRTSSYKSENKKLKQEIISLEAELAEYNQKQVQELVSDDGMSINGDPGNKFFDD